MTVNGLELPASFAEFFEREWSTFWRLKNKVDADGNPFQATDFDPHHSLKRMEENTAWLGEHLGMEDWKPEWIEENTKKPGFIPYIEDFSKTVQFGRQKTGAPFCFDFRENTQEPSVIHWDHVGAYWRRVAPDFNTFISLYERWQDMVEYEDEALAVRIEKAFADVPYPGDDRLVVNPRDWEGGPMAHAFAGKDWRTLPMGFLSDNLFSLHHFTPEAFRYYLPAYLLASLRRLTDEEAETGAVNIPETVVYHVIPARREGFAFDDFQATVSGLTLEQKIVIRDFLRWWDQAVREYLPGLPPEDEIKIAGRRYWESIEQA